MSSLKMPVTCRFQHAPDPSETTLHFENATRLNSLFGVTLDMHSCLGVCLFFVHPFCLL